jgi:hypothetical protein
VQKEYWDGVSPLGNLVDIMNLQRAVVAASRGRQGRHVVREIVVDLILETLKVEFRCPILGYAAETRSGRAIVPFWDVDIWSNEEI